MDSFNVRKAFIPSSGFACWQLCCNGEVADGENARVDVHVWKCRYLVARVLLPQDKTVLSPSVYFVVVILCE